MLCGAHLKNPANVTILMVTKERLFLNTNCFPSRISYSVTQNGVVTIGEEKKKSREIVF